MSIAGALLVEARCAVAVARAAVNLRRGDRPIVRAASLAFSLGDSIIYAGVLHYVVETVFNRASFERFQLTLYGVIVFQWTVRCLWGGLDYGPLQARMAEWTAYPRWTTMAAVLARPTLLSALSLAIAMIIQVVGTGGLPQPSALAWLVPVVMVQAIWTVILVLIVDRLGTVIPGEPLVFFAGALFFVLSPIAYQLSDVPAQASAILTWLNPVSHLLAAYGNVLWFGSQPSLKVLPWVAFVGAVIVVLALGGRGRGRPGVPRSADPDRLPLLVVSVGGGQPPVHDLAPVAGERVFAPWRPLPRQMSAADLSRLLLAAGFRGDPDGDRCRRVAERSEVGSLFAADLSVFPDWALSQLAVSLALESDAPAIRLDRLLDDARPAFIAKAWRALQDAAARGCRVIVEVAQPVTLPADARGRFVVVRAGGDVVRGTIGPELQRAYGEAAARPVSERTGRSARA